MASPLRLLIDYATGENWELPVALYEKYTKDLAVLEASGKPQSNGQTFIQHWLSNLTAEETKQVTKKQGNASKH